MTDRIAFARALRREQTPAERAFWALLYPWRERGLHWRRQAPIGPYVVDFCCKNRKLVVEIDSDSHFSDAGISRDAVRTAYLRQRGFTVLHFTNVDVLESEEGVFEILRGVLCAPDA